MDDEQEYVRLNAPVSQIEEQAVDLRQDLSRVKVRYSNPSQLQVRPDKPTASSDLLLAEIASGPRHRDVRSPVAADGQSIESFPPFLRTFAQQRIDLLRYLC